MAAYLMSTYELLIFILLYGLLILNNHSRYHSVKTRLKFRSNTLV
jgi:hypothetical protein